MATGLCTVLWLGRLRLSRVTSEEPWWLLLPLVVFLRDTGLLMVITEVRPGLPPSMKWPIPPTPPGASWAGRAMSRWSRTRLEA